ncbi:MAG: DUF924 family protein [Candidatus Binatus sp.]
MKRSNIVGEVPELAHSAASRAEAILQFWFASPASEADGFQSRWFVANPQFDDLCKSRFLTSYEDASRGLLEEWRNEARSCLALVLLLDQLPRNMFRGTARAFATDPQARELSRHAIASGYDRKSSPLMRMFLYLPLEHSENLDDQFESVRLFHALTAENPGLPEILLDAEQHLEVIQRFGRFPARNHALGRQSTQEEIDFLKTRSARDR